MRCKSHQSVRGLGCCFTTETNHSFFYNTAGITALTPHGFCQILSSREKRRAFCDKDARTRRVWSFLAFPRMVSALRALKIIGLVDKWLLAVTDIYLITQYCIHLSSGDSRNAFTRSRGGFNTVCVPGAWVCKPWDLLGGMQRPRPLIDPEIV